MKMNLRSSCSITFALLGAFASVEAQSPRCSVFPADHIWNTRVDSLPVHKLSASYVRSIGEKKALKADFGSGLWEGGPIGIPFTTQTGSPVQVQFEYADESDRGPYPLPSKPPIEGGDASNGDRHVIVVDESKCKLYELYNARKTSRGWSAGSGAIFDLRTYVLRPAGWTSADAAGLPIFPGLVRYDEVASGEIKHAIRFTTNITQKAYVWPARHFASSRKDANLPPMGLRLRLKSSYNMNGFSRETRVILQALKTYGMILADNGSPWFLSGAPDERWNNKTLRELGRVTGENFEAVDATGLMMSADSGQIKKK